MKQPIGSAMVLSIVIACVSVLLSCSKGTSAGTDGYRMKGTAGGYTVEMRLDKGPPVEGPNRVTVFLMDRASRPVTGAAVKIDYYMPSFPGRPPMMGHSTIAKPANGGYGAIMELNMKGRWKAEVSITDAKETAKAAFAFEVG